jgi:nucleoid DNA-binding protein
LTKWELAKQLQQSQPDLTQQRLVDIIDTLADLVVCHFVEGGEIAVLRGFGRLRMVRRAAFTGTHPKTGEPYVHEASKRLVFKPSAEAIRRINEVE